MDSRGVTRLGTLRRGDRGAVAVEMAIVGSVVYGNPADYEPCSRDIKIGDGKVDTIGVQVAYTHTWITGVLGLPPQTWLETARARLEPDIFGTGGPSCP